jgi:hypothetical protein
VLSKHLKKYLRAANCQRRQLLQILQQFKRRAGARLRGTSVICHLRNRSTRRALLCRRE